MGILNDGKRWKKDFKGKNLGYICNVCGKRFKTNDVRYHHRIVAPSQKDIAGIAHGIPERAFCPGELVPAVIARNPHDDDFGDHKNRLIVPERLAPYRS